MALTSATLDMLDGAEGVVIVNKSPLDADMLRELHDRGVRYVATRSIGFNHIDIDAAKELGIHVCNTTYPPYGVAEFAVMLMGFNHIDIDAAKELGIHVCNTTYPPYGVAEFAVMLMLMALRNYKPAMWRQQVNDYSLAGLRGRELRTLTVGVMGTGRIGRAVIDYLRGFGCKILAYDPFPGIHVCNTTYPPYGVAEFAVMLMLMALRNYKPAMWRQQVNDYSLAGLRGRELRTLTVGVMGTGRIGRAVIDYLRGFGCKILAYDPFPSEELAARGDVTYVWLCATTSPPCGDSRSTTTR